MAIQTLPPGRAGHDGQVRALAVDAIIEIASAGQVADAVGFVVTNRRRLEARNAMREASARIFAANNFR